MSGAAALSSSARSFTRVALLCGITAVLCTPACQAWGPDGHRIINQLAVEGLPPEMPGFLRTEGALHEIAYLSSEPDRWRGATEPELNSAQSPEHYIDLELADLAGRLPRQRFEFINALQAAAQAHPAQARDLQPQKVGLQPWQTIEVYERLQAALRAYREEKAAGEDTRPVEAAAIFYVGWLGHYVGDGAMPLHTTIHYNGWASAQNPQGYVTLPGIHAEFESAFVHRNLRAQDVVPLLTAVKPMSDPFEDYVRYLRDSHTMVERVYQLEKSGALAGQGTPESRQFVASRLAAGASELRDMIVAAWQGGVKLTPAVPAASASTP